MSSATSTESSVGPSSAFRPWQFFLLAGMLAATATVVVATGQSPASIVFLSFTVIAASFVGLAVYRSLAPLVSPEGVRPPALLGGRTRAALEREKALVLRSIKELEFDYSTKKVAQTDYEEMSARLRSRAIRLMRQLEAGDGYRAAIEKELQARLGAAAIAGPQPADRGGPVGDVRRSRSADIDERTITANVCDACATANDADARFCKSCGERLGGRHLSPA